MNLFTALISIAHAGPSTLCNPDLTGIPFPAQIGVFISHTRLVEDAIKPGIHRVHEDLCKCLPRWRQRWPQSVRANLHIEPNKGRLRIEYRVDHPTPRPVRRMLACMAEPTLTFNPIPYVSDIVRPDGTRGEFPVYPILMSFSDLDAHS